MFDPVLGCGKSKEPSSIETHQQLGAVRVGTLGDHGFADVRDGVYASCWCIFFDVTAEKKVARKSQAAAGFQLGPEACLFRASSTN
jgi:hypothetical protein